MTFDKWWDESYDTFKQGWKRFDGVLKVVEDLSKLSNKQLFEMYKEMKDVIQHNSDLIQNYNIKEVLINRILK
jgi:hypothetical protein